MKKNVGSTDRTIRLLAGIVIILLGIVFKTWWGLLGLVLIITGLFNFCGLYLPFGINTCKVKDLPPEE